MLLSKYWHDCPHNNSFAVSDDTFVAVHRAADDLSPFPPSREERLKRAIVSVLSSAMFWLFVIILVLVDLAIFVWQVSIVLRGWACITATHRIFQPSSHFFIKTAASPILFFFFSFNLNVAVVQIIYSDDHRLHSLEVMIAGIFLLELILRAYAFDLKSLVSWWDFECKASLDVPSSCNCY